MVNYDVATEVEQREYTDSNGNIYKERLFTREKNIGITSEIEMYDLDENFLGFVTPSFFKAKKSHLQLMHTSILDQKLKGENL